MGLMVEGAVTKQEGERLDWILKHALDAECKLTDWESQFVNDLIDRREDDGDAIRVSEKQWVMLGQIYEKVTV